LKEEERDKKKMARIKTKCEFCNETIILFIDDEDSADIQIKKLAAGELFKNKCSTCNKWLVPHVVT